MSPAEDDLALALTLAQEADSLTMSRFGALDLRVDAKPDLTPVTDADHDVEVAPRRRLSDRRPNDSVFGEELGGAVEINGRQYLAEGIRHLVLVAEAPKWDLGQVREIRAWRDSLPD